MKKAQSGTKVPKKTSTGVNKVKVKMATSSEKANNPQIYHSVEGKKAASGTSLPKSQEVFRAQQKAKDIKRAANPPVSKEQYEDYRLSHKGYKPASSQATVPVGKPRAQSGKKLTKKVGNTALIPGAGLSPSKRITAAPTGTYKAGGKMGKCKGGC